MRAFALLAVVAACSTHAYKTYDAPKRPNSVVADVAVRHRRLNSISFSDIAVSSRQVSANLFAGPTPPQQAQPLTPATPQPDKIVIEAWIEMQADEVAKSVAAIRARVESVGGRVVSENVVGAKSASSAAMELRVPPAHALATTAWLATIGIVESRRVLASDVTKKLVDQELELQNLKVTMTRLEKLAEHSGPAKELLEIEREMTRVRGEIERVKGEQRFLVDRVEFATLTVTLRREGGPVELSPHARIFPGPRLAVLALLDPGMRPALRIGGGVTVHVKRFLTFDLDLFPRKDGDTGAAIATVGTALYSGYLGFGQRRFLNPYVGARLGYGYLSASGALVVAGEVGLEVFKHRYLLVETAVRAIAFLRDDSDGALHAMLGFSVPF